MNTPLQVLIVEDSVDDTLLLLDALREGGYDPIWQRVETATAMTVALAQQPWDLVIADHVLPHFNALAALSMLQARGLDCPFIIVSGQIREETAVAAMKAGACDYLLKGNLARLVPAIERELRAAHSRGTWRHLEQVGQGSTEHACSVLANASNPTTILTTDGMESDKRSSCECVVGTTPRAPGGANFFVYLPRIGELCQAIEHNQLLLHYQPQLSPTSNRTVRAEALVRWQHPQHGLIPPDQFVPLAEQTGLIKPLSVWVLNAALRECQTWHRAPQDLQVAVNFSVHNLQETQLGDTVTTLLETWGISPRQLIIEITEGALVTNPARARATLTRLHDLGVQIAIDDFGTGYASLAYLRRLPVDEIKIDKSFVLGMKGDDKDMAIVRSIIDLGHALDLQVVAEGVEDRETYDLLTTLGCDLVQGYYISRPLPDTEFITWLQEPPWYTNQASVIPS